MSRTVEQELIRRKECRYGLRGVLVSLRGNPTSHYKVAYSGWGADGKLRLTLNPFSPDAPEAEPQAGLVFLDLSGPLPEESPGTLRNVAAGDCFLLSD